MFIVKLFYCLTFQQHACKFPEDGDCAETCGEIILIVEYVMYRNVHILLMVEFVIGSNCTD